METGKVGAASTYGATFGDAAETKRSQTSGGWRQDLQRHVPVELGISGPIHLTHAARAEGGVDLVRAEGGACFQGHSYGTGTRSVSSWNQFSTTLICGGVARPSGPPILIMRNRPSGATSKLRP